MNGHELECKSLRRVVLATARVNQKETVELALAGKLSRSRLISIIIAH